MPIWIMAGLWGFVAGLALLLGAAAGYYIKIWQRVVATIMAFDGIPESIVISLSMLQGGTVSTVAVIAVFLSNLPEGLSSATGMRKAGRSASYIFGVWGGIAAVSGIAALLGYALFGQFSPNIVAATTAVAAGAILAMLADTMIPEAFELAHNFAGLITVIGFLVAFVLTKLTEK
jgi:zinc transporter, ZIP family